MGPIPFLTLVKTSVFFLTNNDCTPQEVIDKRYDEPYTIIKYLIKRVDRIDACKGQESAMEQAA